MNYDDINKAVDEYNWDDGFEFPSEVLENELCDLALALKIFYLGDGYGYFEKLKKFNEMNLTVSENGDIGFETRQLLFNHLEDWYDFISKVYNDINNNRYLKSEHHYEIPLTKVQRYKCKKEGIPEIFLEDIMV